MTGKVGGMFHGGELFRVFCFSLPSATYFWNDPKVGKKSPLGVGPCDGTAQNYQGGCSSTSALPVKVGF